MKKKIGVITRNTAMADFYREQLESLFGDIAEIYAYSLQNRSVCQMILCDLYLISVTSYDIMRDEWARQYLPPDDKTIFSHVTFTKSAIDLLKTYPEGTKALLINQTQHMAIESITQLYHLGIYNIEFFPFYPESTSAPDVDLAFTPGEPDMFRPGDLNALPPAIHQVIDLGCRIFTANTISEIALKLGNSFFLESQKFANYLNSLSTIDYSLQKISYNNLTIENKLEIILNSLDAGIVCVDETETVTFINRAARKMLCVSRSEVLGKPVAQAVPHLPLDDSTQTGKPRLLRIRGINFSVVTTPLHIRDQHLGFFFALTPFEEDENRQTSLRLQMTAKSHKARYTFEDILGKSPAICKAKEIAQRMAANDAYVLIEGESGTGKELFAQAIHNASPRCDGPFVAVNCAALTESLLESELFGYVEGAFTGAKKGGKPGLFECAHRGTLFLDEIETMSPALQAKLLRVLQEKEVVRIGSGEPIPVNVRVLSSTNEDLFRRTQEGSFRRDLYYRLNVIPLHIPTLWERRSDILLLVEHFQHQFDTDFVLTDRARAAFLQHRWQGNVRELRNCVEYLQYMGLHIVDYEDLPEQFHPHGTVLSPPEEESGQSGLGLQERWVLQVLGDLYVQHRGIGRQGLVKACLARGFAISEHEVRIALRTLQEKNYISVSRGRGGTSLSEAGFLCYRQLVHSQGPYFRE